jgi:hypothetical protein
MVALAQCESMVVLWLCPTYLLLHIPVVVSVVVANIARPEHLADQVQYELAAGPSYELLWM